MAIGDCASWVLAEAADISKHNIHPYEATIRTYDKNMGILLGGKNTHFFGVLLQKRIEAIKLFQDFKEESVVGFQVTTKRLPWPAVGRFHTEQRALGQEPCLYVFFENI